MRYIYIVLPIILLIMIVIAIKSISSPDFSLVKLEGFNSLKSGIPNNIKIQYEVPKNTELSKWSISAEWSPFENSRLSGYKGEVNLISYYPGYHTTVIQYDGEPVKSIHNFVRTKGWLGIYRDNLAQKIPTYLESKDFINNSKMHLSESLLAKYSETNLAEAYFIEYFNIREFDELTGDNFALSTRFKNSLEDGGKLCQYLILYIYCENDNIIIPFCAPGCIGKIGLKISDSIIKGRESDMRFFGLNMDKWNQLDLEISDLKVKISINSKTILNMSYKNILGLIKGVHYRFYGLGSVDYLLLTASDKKEIYIDNFESPPNDLN